MMGKNKISQYMLEMYQLGLASPKERKLVEAALASDTELRRSYEALVDSDREIRRRYPPENMPVPALFRDKAVREPGSSKQGAIVYGRFNARKRILVVLGAAAAIVCVFFLSVFSFRNSGKKPVEIASAQDPDYGTVQARGTENKIKEFSVSIYPIKTQTNQTENEDGFPSGTQLKGGDSLQVAYAVPSEVRYEGVIFSVFGKPLNVALLFPADTHGNPKLTNGREALGLEYILDSETDFEIFFLVASPNPLNVETIMKTANEAVAGILPDWETGKIIESVREKIYSAFKGYEVKDRYIYVTQ